VLEQLARSTADDVDTATGAVVRLEDVAAQLLELARQLEALARSTERHAASIDRKTGPTVP
jgi:hypothetical protein